MTGIEDLLLSARDAAAAGNKLVARGYLRRASRVAPERVDVWRELLRVTEQTSDRARCLEQIVALDPSDAEAAAALTQLRAEMAAQEAAEAQADAGLSASAPDAVARQEGDLAHDLPAPALVGMRADVTPEMQREWDRAAAAGETLYCIDHPKRETTLRCNRCGAPVCTSCVVRTPVGFRCRACVQAQQAAFYTARWYDLPVAALLSLALSVPAAAIAMLAGWWFAIVISPVAGGLIAGGVHRVLGRRRGRWTWLAVAVGIVVGALAAVSVMALFGSYNLLSLGIYAATATGAAVGVLRLGRAR
ncbi:MAG: B-box zinc finger protein [Anaerolineae bacterium]|nr:B-box zinc finger protein [Anaerolineae bacterium]